MIADATMIPTAIPIVLPPVKVFIFGLRFVPLFLSDNKITQPVSTVKWEFFIPDIIKTNTGIMVKMHCSRTVSVTCL